MSRTNRSRTEAELRQIEDAIIDSILTASPEDLRADLHEAGEDPDALVRAADEVFRSVADRCAREKLEAAKAAAAAFRAKEPPTMHPIERERAKARLQRMTSGGQSSPMMLAARKGEGPSANDQDAILRAMAELEELEEEDDEA
jgi:hypothetical protein